MTIFRDKNRKNGLPIRENKYKEVRLG